MRGRNLTCAIGSIASLLALGAWLQGQATRDTQLEVKQRFAELKQAMAQNRAKLRNYAWTETTDLSIKGDTKKDVQKACHIGPDGKVVKTQLGLLEAPKELPGGLRGKVAKKKLQEMKDYTDRLKSLIGHYVPPDPQRMQASFQAGKAKLDVSSAGVTSLTFNDYYKQGDSLAISFDTASKKLTGYDVNTYLDGPKDVVTLANQFSVLPDDTNYLQQTILTSKSKEIQIKTTNSDYVPRQ